jgi:hypothetical protein
VATAFKRKGDRFVARLDDIEREVVVGLMQQVLELVEPEAVEATGDAFEDLVATIGVPRLDEAGPVEEPEDPALARLLPSGNKQDEAVASEFRRLTEHGLRERKAANLEAAIDALTGMTGDKVTLERAQAQAVVVALTDVRLVLGERLGLRTDEDADALVERLEQAGEHDIETMLAAYYDFLTWLQESLTLVLMG